jgi:hypothetical protein
MHTSPERGDDCLEADLRATCQSGARFLLRFMNSRRSGRTPPTIPHLIDIPLDQLISEFGRRTRLITSKSGSNAGCNTVYRYRRTEIASITNQEFELAMDLALMSLLSL